MQITKINNNCILIATKKYLYCVSYNTIIAINNKITNDFFIEEDFNLSATDYKNIVACFNKKAKDCKAIDKKKFSELTNKY